LVVKKVVGVSPILVILALIIGAKLAGFLGIVLSAPAVAALMEFFDDVGKRKVMQWQKVEEKSKA
jgi:predicted PurR-regulated permease PerM